MSLSLAASDYLQSTAQAKRLNFSLLQIFWQGRGVMGAEVAPGAKLGVGAKF